MDMKGLSPITISFIYSVTEQTRQPIAGYVKLSVTVKWFMEIIQETVKLISGDEQRRKKKKNSILEHKLKEQDIFLRRDKNYANFDGKKNWKKYNDH